MIKELTKEQEMKLKEYEEKWIRIGRSTEPINFEESKKAVKLAYECANLEEPKTYIYCRSPYEAVCMINKAKGNKKFENVNSTIEGQHLGWFTGFYTFFRNECGLVEQTDIARGIFAITETCGWVYLFKEVAYICDRYSKLNIDERGKLHCEDGYAFEFTDGFGDTFWHGTKVPKWIIFEKEKITIEKIFEERNKEIQRCMMEMYGLDKILEKECKLIHSDDWGDLYHTKTLKDSFGKPLAYLKVINSTPDSEHVSKREVDEVFVKVQKEMDLSMYDARQGDVGLRPTNLKKLTIDEASKLRKEFKGRVLQELDIIFNKKRIENDLKYKEYILQVKPDCKTALEAFQMGFRKLENFIPIIES